MSDPIIKQNEGSLHRTNITIRNLHCPSCVKTIQDSLKFFSPLDVHVSLVNQLVSITHDSNPDLPYLLCERLQQQGFEVGNATLSTIVHGSSYREPIHILSSKTANFNAIKHEEYCQMCQEKTESSEPTQIEMITLSLPDITCASCVNTIKAGLEKVANISDVHINLMRKQMTFKASSDDASQIVIQTIEDLGYSTHMISTLAINKKPSTWLYLTSINGMHCASCVKKISDALNNVDEILMAKVDLMSNSASIESTSADLKDTILKVVASVGYKGQILSVHESKKGQESSTQKEHSRRIQILIEGMHCKHCPPKILSALEQFGPDIIQMDDLSIDNPILNITYLPNAPTFTIRDICQKIESAGFSPTIYKPPSADDVSREMRKLELNNLLHLIFWSGIISIPTFFFGMIVMTMLPHDHILVKYFMSPIFGTLNLTTIILFLLATPVQFYIARSFHKRALGGIYRLWKPYSQFSISHRLLRFGSMDLLISAGISVAYFSSLISGIFAIFGTYNGDMSSRPPTYFDSTVFLTFFVLIGRYLEAQSKIKTSDAASMLLNLQPENSLLLPAKEMILTDYVEIGDNIRIVGGAQASVDGTVIYGESVFNEAALTGESSPVRKTIGDSVFAGTLNVSNSVDIRVTAVAENTFLASVVEVVNEGQRKQAPIEKLADSITAYFVPFITALAILTWLYWVILGYTGVLESILKYDHPPNWMFWALKYSIAVFVVACPCGIGLAAPTACFVGGYIAAKHGIIPQGGGESFQYASEVSSVIFDKTGTLTHGGDPKVTNSQIDNKSIPNSLVISALHELEASSSHPLARAVVNYLKEKHSSEIVQLELRCLEEVPGCGLIATIPYQGKTYKFLVGNERWLSENGLNPMSPPWKRQRSEWTISGNSVVMMSFKDVESDGDFTLCAQLSIRDTIRKEAKVTIDYLKSKNYTIYMMTGDNQQTARAIAYELGINQENVVSEVKPQDKARQVQRIQSTSSRPPGFWSRLTGKQESRSLVAFVGDGINDAPALTRADVGIALGSGSDIAIQSSDFLIVKSDLRSIIYLLDLSKKVYSRILFNFGWAMVYNIIGVPIAAGVFLPFGVTLDPVWASLAMALSSISVVLSSFAINFYKPPKLITS